MNYEEKYKEVLEKAQKELQCCGTLDCDAARQIFRFFPELAESEDEKIRKEFIEALKGCGFTHFDNDFTVQEAITWLEKQGEKDSQAILPTFTFEDILAVQCCMQAVSKNDELYKKLQSLHDRLHEVYGLEKQGEQKPSWDSGIRKNLICFFKREYGTNSNARFAGIEVKDIIAWIEKQGEHNIAWSEKDEKNMNTIINVIYGGTHLAYENEIDWLKSLKYRIKEE